MIGRKRTEVFPAQVEPYLEGRRVFGEQRQEWAKIKEMQLLGWVSLDWTAEENRRLRPNVLPVCLVKATDRGKEVYHNQECSALEAMPKDIKFLPRSITPEE